MEEDEIQRLSDEINRLKNIIRDIYEIWARSEGIPEPKTAAESYLLFLVKRMRDKAINGL